MRRVALALLLGGLGSTVVACTEEDRVCTLIAVPGLDVTVRAADTNQPLTTATVVVRDGDYVVEGSPGPYATERPGIYTITASSTGYQAQTVERVVALDPQDDCHVVTEQVQLVLLPAPALSPRS